MIKLIIFQLSKEFIEKRIGIASIVEARRQQKELSYFTQSSIQQPVTEAYLKEFAQRKYESSDEFLNWLKTIFGTDTFLSAYKHLRFPVPSAKLVNNKILPQLQRVFFSEDSFFTYNIRGKEVETPDSLDAVEFDDWIFKAMLFRHNDILITDLKGVNQPFRDLVSIDNVVALESSKSVIKRIAYSASVSLMDESGNINDVEGYVYMDDKEYAFYDKEIELRLSVPHDLGQCPADYISNEAFTNDDIIRKSAFSFVKADLEEFTLLRTLQKMSDVNGTIPVTAILKFQDKTADGYTEDVDYASDNEPNIVNSMGSQQARFQAEVVGKPTEVQPGRIIDVTPRLKEDGSIDSAAVQNYIKHFYMPVESMAFVNDRIMALQNDIIQSVTGDFKEQNETAQNEKQVSKGYITKEDSLRALSKGLSRIRRRSDYKMLSLEFGSDSVSNQAFYGTDFFPESQTELYELFEKAPNPIERKNLLIRMNKTKNRFNKSNSLRQIIMYDLMPYSSDIDFQIAREALQVSPEMMQLQTRFDSWINLFEAKYGDLVVFWESYGDSSTAERLTIIKNLLLEEVKTAIVPPINPPTTV